MTEGPYKLPKGWRWVKLGEVSYKPEYGYTASATMEPVGPKFLRITDITSGQIDWEQVPYCQANEKVIRKYRLSVGDILFARSGSVGATIVIKEPPPEAIFASYLIRVRLRGQMLPEYAKWVLKSPVCQLQLVPQGAAQRNINAKHIQQLLIPLPPLEEQRRIVARIEELMARVREAQKLRKEAMEDAERLWQSVLANTFPHPGQELPKGWRWVKLGEIFEIQQGASMSPKRRLGRNPKPFLRTRNILWGAVDISSLDEMDFTDEEVERLRLRPGDLLVCEGGEVGKTAIWEGQLDVVLYQNHIHRLRAKDNSVEPRFIMYWVQAAYQVFSVYQGAESRTAIPNLSAGRLKEFLAPLPPLEEQRQIAAYLQSVQERIKALREAQSATEAELQRLEQAILDKAFRGEL
ncbi:restriction endonuclease subunit S [Hydrogenobacter thermophilus]|uniref:restriction endonuclease subunit S n=1 Tax=Hydrogenobacter thermophilus TaxID=940 RepID=UPI0030F7A8A1